jgi:hypothetical protein
MGAIQQAFNQALNIGAIALGPTIATKKKERADIKKGEKELSAIEKQTTAASKNTAALAQEYSRDKDEVSKSLYEQADIKEEELLGKQEAVLERLVSLDPSDENLAYLESTRIEKAAIAANRAARQAAEQKEIYNDQKRNMDAIKSKGKQLMETASKIKAKGGNK